MMTRSGRTCAVALLVLVAVLAPATSALAKGAPAGFRTVTVAKAGFSIAVPKDWVTVDATSGNVTKVLKKVRKAFPDLGDVLPANASTLIAQHLKLLVLDKEGASFHANLNAIVFDQGESVTEADIQQQLEQIDSGVNVESATIAGKSGIKATVHLSGNASDGSTVEVVATQYYVKGPKGVLEITFSSAADDPKTDVRDAMIGSLSLKA
jgi:hypothetical protein